MPRKPTGYGERLVSLKTLGFKDYAEYLKSDLWGIVRMKVMQGNPTCSLCPRPADQVHHLSYTVADLIGETLDQLKPICKGCHYRVEFHLKRKRTFREATLAYLSMAQGIPYPGRRLRSQRRKKARRARRRRK